MHPPRALKVPFELGRPLGAPSDAHFQTRVLAHALGLLSAAEPVVDWFYDDAPDLVETTQREWSCPVTFAPPESSTLQTLLNEVATLKPWFDRGRARRGHSATGTSALEIEAVCELLTQFEAGETPEIEDASAISVGDRFKLAAEDLKMYYAEAVMEQPNPGSARQIQQWFWQQTQAGALLLRLSQGLAKHENKVIASHAAFTLVPVALRGKK